MNDLRAVSGDRFDRVCRLTGMNNSRLARELGESLQRRTLTRQTLAGWRSAAQPVPFEVFLAALRLAGPSAHSMIAREFERDSWGAAAGSAAELQVVGDGERGGES